ncbi:DUF2922 family protein [Enterococcus raffinosus]|uniref:DUF2922 family protein n=1 Tax=Enterococcus raffinosus TaxID=71452 RepID=A0AAW8T9U7_9ENTE|nr:DUF2922 family protein [Enterococcus raffinosus]MDT2522696.1 DUF2922 family protein [Enterococcus raffinosus]MDT2529914.1 DUF2922 family protein [Enterococcus raffinosus]MDT2532938.1 DUF2922 family protein [Enterococcus raffinosus]MDT2543877.1 DUF2922 family protein [Enterococcus raffinosus]MDT2554984.1 DUF2922 family protein [Enterococcus raffinosus]
MITTFTLDAEFANSDGSSQHLRLKNFDPTKTAEEIKASLTKLTQLNLFEKDGVGLFKKVLHATIIEKRVETIFDKRVETQTKDSSTKMMEQAQSETLQNLTITEERPSPSTLIQKIELPKGLDPWSLNENQAIELLQACMPSNATLMNVEVDDQSVPARLIITEVVEEQPIFSEAEAVNETPPEKSRKRRKRLIDRIRKRE